MRANKSESECYYTCVDIDSEINFCFKNLRPTYAEIVLKK